MSRSIQPSLSAREARILIATIESYIATSSPISSRFLKRHRQYAFSPATIRNILARLEKMDLLTHPHTSSGRIPTDQGYRYYAEQTSTASSELMPEYEFLLEELTTVATNVDKLMEATAIMLAKLSHLFGVVILSGYQRGILSDLEIIPLSSDRIMLVLVLETGLVRNIVMNLKVAVNEKSLELVASILKERLVGLSLEEVQYTIDERLQNTSVYRHEIVQVLLAHPEQHFSVTDNRLIYTSSLQELLNQPEFRELNVLQKTLQALEDEHLMHYFSQHLNENRPYILIGAENRDQLLNHCSILTTSFRTSTLKGQLGILGPTRLPYPEVQEILTNFAELIPSVC